MKKPRSQRKNDRLPRKLKRGMKKLKAFSDAITGDVYKEYFKDWDKRTPATEKLRHVLLHTANGMEGGGILGNGYDY